ncbi:MAG TPA: efflux RND transporter periplasmic adaptor subunit [Verrucomicrobiota bacterium]|nr:efflux RND transporter periplasmic adaptor subunit [Verrucomicrobiota bacterium]
MTLMQRDPKTPTLVTAGKVVLAALGCTLFLTACGRQQAAPPTAPPPPTVTTVPMVREQVLLTTELAGRTSPYRIAEIRPQVNGLIKERLFTEGANVQSNQPLYQIDPAPFKAAFESAKAALGRAEANLPAIQARADRFKAALADRAVSQQDYDDAAAALKQADADILYWKAAVETARINLDYARVVSPISGRIGPSSVTDGAIVTAYQPVPLATIQQLDPIYVDVPYSTTELLRLQRRLREGQLSQSETNVNAVDLLLPDGAKYDHEGALQFRDVSVDPTMGTVTLRMVFPNPNGVLLPGMFVRVIVKEGINKQAILVPQQAVSRDHKGNPTTLIVVQGKVEMRQLTVEREVRDRWLVTAGVEAGDKVIMEGMQKVRPGMPVTEVPFGEPQPQTAPPGAKAPPTPTAH